MHCCKGFNGNQTVRKMPKKPSGKKVTLRKNSKSKTPAEWIKEKEYLGFGMEGEVRAHEFEISGSKGKSKRNIMLAVKKYHPNFPADYVIERLEVMQELQEMRRQQASQIVVPGQSGAGQIQFP